MGITVRRPERLDTATAEEVRSLAASVAEEDGAPPLSDRGLTLLGSASPGHAVALDGETVAGYLQLDGDSAEICARPEAIDALLDSVRPGLVWSHATRSRLLDALGARGARPVRDLLHLRRQLGPADDPAPELPDGVTVRAFEPGRDEEQWLALNAAAFADHPEQGRLSRDDLQGLTSEPWFDPAGFLLAERDHRLVGFHWTKVHPSGLGEVYVLGVAPQEQGSGLGSVLLDLGLRLLRARGCPSVLLYVEADNAAARHVYARSGFVDYDRDVQWALPR